MPKIIIITNSSLFIVQHLEPIINKLKKYSDLYLICPYDPKHKIRIEGLKLIYIPLKRNPSWTDLISLILTFSKTLPFSRFVTLTIDGIGNVL